MLVMKFLLKAIYEKYAYFLNSQEAKKNLHFKKQTFNHIWFIYNLRLQKVKTRKSIAKNVVLAVT